MPITKDKNDYFENNKPVHRVSYCAFLDILGFSERIMESHRDGLEDQLLDVFYEIFRKQIEKLKSEQDESSIYFKSFSDNILIAHPQFSLDMEAEFGFTLWSVSEYQYAMALKGYFIRGGFSVGSLFVDENNVYGEALIKAYELESKQAVNPMVVLCDRTMKLVDKHLSFYYKDFAPQRDSVFVNSDGRYFINYLNESVIQTEMGVEILYEDLAQHKENIEKSLAEYKSQPHIFSKFTWLAAYHNFFCESVSAYRGYEEKLRINDSHVQPNLSFLPTNDF